jgi:hypothetical protein
MDNIIEIGEKGLLKSHDFVHHEFQGWFASTGREHLPGFGSQRDRHALARRALLEIANE